MKKHLKIYFSVVLCSTACVLFPWALAWLGVVSEVDVLNLYSGLFAGAALALSAVYAVVYLRGIKIRMAVILLNPAFFYLIFLTVLRVLFAREEWNGFL